PFRVSAFDPEVFGPSTGYTVSISRSEAPIGSIFGSVLDGVSGAPVTSAFIELELGVDTIETRPFPDGAYLIDAPPGTRYLLRATAPGYRELVVDRIDVLANSFVAQPLILQADASSLVDSDTDGLPDAYEDEVGLDRNDPDDAGLDPDQDGLSSFDEYLIRTDPFVSNAPSSVVFESPSDGGDSLAPLSVTIFNSIDPDGDPVGYDFVLLSDDRTLTLDQSTTLASGTDGRTSWTAAAAVDDSQFYRVQAIATDGIFRSPVSEIRVRVVL
ncbi:MAG: carboxypeptidase-like regulatory domain-containing protein, partial [Myxococcota bacterium]